MSMDWEEARREAYYDELVEEILHDHKEEIIEEFQEGRLASYYIANPEISEGRYGWQGEPSEGIGGVARKPG